MGSLRCVKCWENCRWKCALAVLSLPGLFLSVSILPSSAAAQDFPGTPADSSKTADAKAPPIPAKARKHLDKGLAAFRAGQLKRAQQELKDAYHAAPQSAATNYLLGALYLRMNDLPQSERYFASAAAIQPRDVAALVGLGHVRYQQGDLQGSAEALHQAVAVDATNWQALWLLAQIDLRRRNFPRALSEAQDAVQSAHGKAAGAEFIEGEAQAELGRTAEAIRTLQAFLKDAPSDPNAPLARQLAGKLELFPAAQQTPGTFVMNLGPTTRVRLDAAAKASDATPALAVSAPVLPLPNWEPPSADEQKPPVADGVVCPAGEVIRKAGERVSELVNDINRIDATENVTQEELSVLGRPIATEKRTFDYEISIMDSSSGLLNVSESRRSADGSTFLDHVSMFGLADLPLVFHSSLRRDFTLTCEGLGQWDGRATWLVYFRQRSDRPAQIRSYQFLDGSSYDAALDGRAWIAADTDQIVRIQAGLMKAIPQIGIGSEEDVIEYGPVPFHSLNGVLWLPKSADIYYSYKHRPYHRHHAFRDYRLFSVSASEKIAPPDVTRIEEKNNRQR